MNIFNKYINWIQKIILLVFLLSMTQLSFAGSPGTYREQAYEMIDKVKKVFVQNGFCVNTDSCSLDIFFVGPNSDGFNATIYTVTSAKIIKKINSIATEIYFKNNQKLTIKTYFYKESHKDVGFFKSSFINLTLNKQGE